MSATIGGQVWNATTVTASRTASGFSIGGSDSQNQLSISANSASAPGNYLVGPTVSISAQLIMATGTGSGAGLAWRAGGTAGSGAVSVTTVTSEGASGTFSFILVPESSGATGNKVIGGGTFNVTF